MPRCDEEAKSTAPSYAAMERNGAPLARAAGKEPWLIRLGHRLCGYE